MTVDKNGAYPKAFKQQNLQGYAPSVIHYTPPVSDAIPLCGKYSLLVFLSKHPLCVSSNLEGRTACLARRCFPWSKGSAMTGNDQRCNA